jgi:beta-glucosidase
MVTIVVAGALCAATAAAVTPATASSAALPWLNAKQSPVTRAAELLAAMTLADKVNMLHGIDSSQSPVPTVGYIPPIKRLGVPPITMTDGPAGVRNGQKSTELPAPIAVAASWDTALAKKYGTVLGRDSRDLGQDQLFGPGMNIDRVALNGRNFEYFSEDPVLSGTIAGADVSGIQAQGTIATIKHYVANNSETNRTSVSADISDRALHEIYEKNFGIAVATGQPGSVMCSYNRINTVYSCSNPDTLGSLRSQFGFNGYVVSDYPATHATTDIAAGLNVELPTGVHLTLDAVRAALQSHEITMAEIDQRVSETLRVLFQFGIFDRALTVTPIDQPVDNAAAMTIEEQSAVLLKNSAGALPLTAAQSKIAVIGTTAKSSAQGGGSSQVNPLSVDNAYDAIVSRAGTNATVTYNDGSDTASAATTAAAADVAVVFVRDSSSEGSDRSTLALSGNQDSLIESVAAANPHTIVVLETGAPALMPWIGDVQGVLEAWYPGAKGGAAIAHLLWGDVNPSGKLQQTWPVSDSQVPTSTPEQFPGVDGTESYSEGVDVGYRWYDANDQQPLFPFGYGLSYSTFKYSNLTLSRAAGTSDQSLKVSVDVTNTGHVSGRDAVQVYVSKPSKLAATPPRELAAFGKVELAAGQTKRVTMTIDPRELSYWDTQAQRFTVQDGKYTVAAGGSSRSLPLSKSYLVTRTDGPVRLSASPEQTTTDAGKSVTVTAQLRNLSDYTDTKAGIAVAAPPGWTVQALTPTTVAKLAKNQFATAKFKVSIPAAAKGGTYQLTVTSSGTVHGSAAKSQTMLTVIVPFASLEAAYDTVGLTDDSNHAPGNWDPAGYSYSAQGLAAAGVTPGGTLTVSGSSVTFPAQAPGTDDAVTAAGQVVNVNAKTAHLVIVGAATYGEVTAQIHVTYTDATSADIPVDFSDWYSNAAASGSSLVATTRWNGPPGVADHDVSIYGAVAAVDSSKTIATITLPNSTNLHFFTVSPETS